MRAALAAIIIAAALSPALAAAEEWKELDSKATMGWFLDRGFTVMSVANEDVDGIKRTVYHLKSPPGAYFKMAKCYEPGRCWAYI